MALCPYEKLAGYFTPTSHRFMVDCRNIANEKTPDKILYKEDSIIMITKGGVNHHHNLCACSLPHAICCFSNKTNQRSIMLYSQKESVSDPSTIPTDSLLVQTMASCHSLIKVRQSLFNSSPV